MCVNTHLRLHLDLHIVRIVGETTTQSFGYLALTL